MTDTKEAPASVSVTEELSYPIAEIFESPQGEGGQTGILQTHVRLAGCNVGKPYTFAVREQLGLDVYQERCTAWNDMAFPCDTNYRKAERRTLSQLLDLDSDPLIGKAQWISLTGGEPLMHDVAPLVIGWLKVGKSIHIETSGTKLFSATPLLRDIMYKDELYVVVSPKQGCLPHMLELANEIRILVDRSFDEDDFFGKFGQYYDQGKVWISPVNDLHALDTINVRKCLELQTKYKNLRLSIQTHKVLGVR